jgi:rubrerythrin
MSAPEQTAAGILRKILQGHFRPREEDSSVTRFIAQQNIRRFERLLAEVDDEGQRATLRELLEAERQKLADEMEALALSASTPALRSHYFRMASWWRERAAAAASQQLLAANHHS